MDNCIFCKIVDKEIPAEIIFENDHAIVIKDINPQAKVHLLAISKKHIGCINDIDESFRDDLMGIHLAIKEAVKIVNVSETGYRVISNCGKGAGQTVMHLHYHIIADDGISERLI
jgi:histidine triad (HIT) family protein